jgi:hypothetical protein
MDGREKRGPRERHGPEQERECDESRSRYDFPDCPSLSLSSDRLAVVSEYRERSGHHILGVRLSVSLPCTKHLDL